MTPKEILTSGNISTPELQRPVTKEFKGLTLTYNEVYYLDYSLNEITGMIDKLIQVEHYTKEQMDRNMEALENAYTKATQQYLLTKIMKADEDSGMYDIS